MVSLIKKDLTGDDNKAVRHTKGISETEVYPNVLGGEVSVQHNKGEIAARNKDTVADIQSLRCEVEKLRCKTRRLCRALGLGAVVLFVLLSILFMLLRVVFPENNELFGGLMVVMSLCSAVAAIITTCWYS